MAGPWIAYDSARRDLCDGTLDLDADSLSMALFTSASNAANVTLSALNQLTNPVANASSKAMPSTWLPSGSDMWLRGTSMTYTASSGALVGVKYAVLHDDSGVLLAHYKLVDTAITIPQGETLVCKADRVFKLSS